MPNTLFGSISSSQFNHLFVQQQVRSVNLVSVNPEKVPSAKELEKSKQPKQPRQQEPQRQSQENRQISETRSSTLNSLIHPLLLELKRRHNYNLRRDEGSSGSSSKLDVVDELRNAFEVAERSSPGISGMFVNEVVHKLLGRPHSQQHQHQQAMTRLPGDSS